MRRLIFSDRHGAGDRRPAPSLARRHGLIARLLDGIETGGGALVLRGEPGIGKSRLLAEAAARAPAWREASAPQRRRVHEALANAPYSDIDRRVWHRAALISGAHEEVAMELEDAGRRARRRGATGVAFTALRRAAELSEPARRIPRLWPRPELAFELGEPGAVSLLLQEVARLEPGRLERARATWIEEVVHPRPLADGARATALIAEAGRAGEAGDRELQLDLLWLVAQRAWWSDP